MSRTTALTNSPNPGEQADRLNQDGSAAEQIGVAPVKVSAGADPSPTALVSPASALPARGFVIDRCANWANGAAE